MKTLAEMKIKGDLIITDPFYIVRQQKLEDEDSKPKRESFYPEDWIPPSEEDYFNNTEKALLAKRYEQNYNNAVASWKDSLPNDWDICNYGESMGNLGIRKCIVANTIYGSWSCTVYDVMSNAVLGKFISDSGLVGVFLLSEILSYNPEWDLHLSKPYCAAMIPNFKGIVSIMNSGGASPGNCDVRVVGKGNIKFFSKQTGF